MRGPSSAPITPLRGSFFHAAAQYNYDKWDEGTIDARGLALFNLARLIWSPPPKMLSLID